MSDDSLDKLFQDAAEKFQPEFEAESWEKMSAKLDNPATPFVGRDGSLVGWKTITSLVTVGILSSVLLYTYIDSDPKTGDLKSSGQIVESSEALTAPSSSNTQIAQGQDNYGVKENTNEEIPGSKVIAANASETSVSSKSEDATPEGTAGLDSEVSAGSTMSESASVGEQRNAKEAITDQRASASSKVASATATSDGQAGNRRITPNAVDDHRTQPQQSSMLSPSSISRPVEGEVEAEPQRTEIPETGEGSAVDNNSSTKLTQKIEPESGNTSKLDSQVSSNAEIPAREPSAGQPERDGGKTSVSAESLTRQQNNKAVLVPSDVNTDAGISITEKEESNVESKILVGAERKDELESPVDENVTEVPDKQQTATSFPRGFSIKIGFSPDFSSINFRSSSGMGFNVGVIGEYRFAKHWSIAAGLITSKKVYSGSDVEYEANSKIYVADDMVGGCNVMDLPILISYNFGNPEKYSFFVSTGISSYMMMKENYTWSYDNGNEFYVETSRENNDWFKTANFSIGVQKKLSRHFYVQVEPFVKAPLAGVGEGKVSLTSLGAFMNLKYSFK